MGILASLATPGPRALSSHKDTWNTLSASHPEQLLAVTCVGYLGLILVVCLCWGWEIWFILFEFLFLLSSLVLVKELDLPTNGFNMFSWKL